MNKCLFLDRDGTLNVFNNGFNYKKEHIQFIPGVTKLLRRFCELGYKIIIITNQGGVGMGLYTEEDVIAINRYIGKLLLEEGVTLSGVYYCPHHEEKGKGKYKVACSCRKPGNLLLERAISEFNADRQKSLFIGDNFTDKLCAQKSNVAFYPFSFRNVKSTSQGFRVVINEYNDELIEKIIDFAQSL